MSFFLLSFALSAQLLAQGELDLQRLNRTGEIEIPFYLENNFIVIDVYLDNLIPLRFIVDTGAEHTVILDKNLTDFLNISYQREYDISGADMDSVLTAYLATGVNFRLANSLLAKNRTLLVLKENYFQFERITGTNIHGILGGDFLARFVVEFDYSSRVMTLHDPGRFKAGSRFQPISASFVRNRPFLELPISVNGYETNDRKLLLDTGAGLFILLYTSLNDSSDLPQRIIPTSIAHGLGGAIRGNVGRAKSVTVGKQTFGDVITYFQANPGGEEHFQLTQRDGIVGNALLRRFQLVIDYVREKVYLKPVGKWKRPVKFDRSGLQIAAGGKGLRTFLITHVLPDSPAAEAGLQVGDRIKKMNGTPTGLLTLTGIFNRLERKAGKRVRLTVKRLTGEHKFEFRLRDLI